MLILSPLSRAPDFKITRVLLFIFFTFFIVGNSYADKIYKVQANDFLSKIVKKNYSINSDISKEQAMVAILRANPEAFRGGNIHFLRRVDALTLPSTEVVALITHAEALKTVNKHYTFFKRNKTGNFPPIALKRPTQKQDNTETKTNSISTSTETEKTTTKNPETEISAVDSVATSTNAIENQTVKKPDSASPPDDISTTVTETSTPSAESITSTASSITDNNLEQQQKATIKTEQIQELEKRKGEQDTTLNQLDNKIKTLEKSIINQTTTPQNNTEETTTTESTEPASQPETMSGLDSLASLSGEDADNTTPIENTEPTSQPETMSGLDSLASLSGEDADNNTDNTEPTSQPETMSGLDSLASLSDENADNNTDNTEPTSQPETMSGLDSLDTLSGEDADNNTTEKTSDFNQPVYLWLLLPIFALLGFLWWKKSNTPSATDVDTNPTTSLAKKNQPYSAQTKEPPHHHPQSIEKIPTNNVDEIDNTEKPTIHSNEEESAIKLDMASAYQAMGYPEEAKEMLEEVIQEGTPQQKEMAESLLAVL